MGSHRSVSQFKSYNRCSEQYRLKRTLDLPAAPSAAIALGKAFHQAYDTWEWDGREGPLSPYFVAAWDETLEDQLKEQPDLTLWNKAPRVKEVQSDIDLRFNNGVVMSDAYEEHCRASPWKVVESEWTFQVDVGSVTVWGALDTLLRWPSNNQTIRDLKTGNREDSGFQLGVYAYALRHLKQIDITWGEFYYTKDGKSVAYDLSRYTDAYMEEMFAKLDDGINREIYMPNPGSICTMCDVKKHCREMGDK